MKTTNRKGFSLIELLIVVVIIGILAAIAIPKFANTKEKAYVAQNKSDLKNLASAQEAYFGDVSPNSYANTGQIQGAPYSWTVSGGAAITPVTVTGTASGWSAVMTYTRVTNPAQDMCGIYGGSGPIPAGMPATTPEGVVACW